MTDFPASQDATTTDRYIETIIPRLRNHLGLVFHRLIANGTVSITIDVEDTDALETPSPQPVHRRRPVRLPPGAVGPDYPKALAVQLDSGTVELRLPPLAAPIRTRRVQDSPYRRSSGSGLLLLPE